MTLVIDLSFLISLSFSLIISKGSVSIFCLRFTIYIFLTKLFSYFVLKLSYPFYVRFFSPYFGACTSNLLSEAKPRLFSLCRLSYLGGVTSILVAVRYKFYWKELKVLHFLFLSYLSKDSSILFLLSLSKQFSSCDWFIM